MIPRQFLIAVILLAGLVIGMSVYVWRLRERQVREEQPAVQTSANKPVAPPAAGPTEQATVYVAYDDPGELRAQSINIPLSADRQQHAAQLLRALLDLYTAKGSSHPLGPGSDIRDVFLADPGIAVIDLNSALADTQVSGVLTEELTVCSLAQTLATNLPGLVRVKFLVDGKERDTLAGHVDLSNFFDVSQVAEMAKSLGPH